MSQIETLWSTVMPFREIEMGAKPLSFAPVS